VLGGSSVVAGCVDELVNALTGWALDNRTNRGKGAGICRRVAGLEKEIEQSLLGAEGEQRCRSRLREGPLSAIESSSRGLQAPPSQILRSRRL